MRRSVDPIKTKRQPPADEPSNNARLLARAGYISKEIAGVYSYLPLGLRVLNKITEIIRQEMNAIGAMELSLSALQDPDIWQKTDRWSDQSVNVWFKTNLKNGREVGLGITHEEPLVRILSQHIVSYKDLPAFYYQFQTKFRNELRAKSGLMRGREFLMKDLYSFAETDEQHNELYEKVAASYLRIFQRLGIGKSTYRTFASGGPFSKYSEEYQTICDFGEDNICVQKDKGVAINKEIISDEVQKELGLEGAVLQEYKSVEIGNIFNLGTKYSKPLGLDIIHEDGSSSPVIMGSYGLGISRLMGLMAELFSDDQGLIWPSVVAPYRVYLVTIGSDQSVLETANQLYQDLVEAGEEVLFDDRHATPGEKFADSDLLGIPLRLVVSPKTIQENSVEMRVRGSDQTRLIKLDSILQKLKSDQ